MLEVALETHLDAFHLSLNFTSVAGKTTVLLGESGAGKSTVLRLLAGLLHPHNGHIALDGTIYFDSEQRIIVPPQERPFGYVFQDYVLFPHLSVFENVAFGLRAQHLAQRVIRQRVGEALERVHLSGFDTRRPSQLSGGQQQRAAIARALALHPRLLLLDEPLSALDVQTRREVRQELRHILAETGITTVLVTHNYLEALLFGQHILVLDHGRVIQQGEQRDLLAYPRSHYVAELIGVNFFRGHILHYDGPATCVIQLDYNSHGTAPVELVATLRERSQEEVPAINAEAYVVVDPRNVTLHQTPPEGSARNIFRGRIVQIIRLGTLSSNNSPDDGQVRISIALDGEEGRIPPLTAEVTEASVTRMKLSEGKTIYATFKAVEASAYT